MKPSTLIVPKGRKISAGDCITGRLVGQLIAPERAQETNAGNLKHEPGNCIAR
jgi:hypothetical protein